MNYTLLKPHKLTESYLIQLCTYSDPNTDKLVMRLEYGDEKNGNHF